MHLFEISSAHLYYAKNYFEKSLAKLPIKEGISFTRTFAILACLIEFFALFLGRENSECNCNCKSSSETSVPATVNSSVASFSSQRKFYISISTNRNTHSCKNRKPCLINAISKILFLVITFNNLFCTVVHPPLIALWQIANIIH